ncbi:hypothetical protein MRX96_058481 [Rhipicephalus microplus]
MLMHILDQANRGFLYQQEFMLLYRAVQILWASFRSYDRNNSGWIRRIEVRAALGRLGLSDVHLNVVLGPGEPRRWVSLDQYLQIGALALLNVVRGPGEHRRLELLNQSVRRFAFCFRRQ